jgi:hypothetical protein
VLVRIKTRLTDLSGRSLHDGLPTTHDLERR